MSVKIPPEVRAAMKEIARKFGRQGGKASAKNLTAEERSVRARNASLAAAAVRTARAKEKRAAQPAKSTGRKRKAPK
jgi:hypothetical protein